MNSSNYLKILAGYNAINKANIQSVVCTLKPAQTPSLHNVRVYASTGSVIFDQNILTSDVPALVAQLPAFKEAGTNANGDVTLVNTSTIRDAADTPDQTSVSFHYTSGASVSNLSVVSSDAFYA